MIPSAYQMLLSAVERQCQSPPTIFQQFLTHYNTFPRQNLQEGLLALAYQCGLKAHPQGVRFSRYCTLLSTTDDPFLSNTLLLGLTYQNEQPESLLPLFASLLTILSYQEVGEALPFPLTWLLYEASSDMVAAQAMLDPVEQFAQALETFGGLCPNAQSCLWFTQDVGLPQPGPTPLLALGCKGSLSLEVQLQTAQHDLPLSYGNVLPNAAWRLLWALSSLKDAREDILLENFYDAISMPADELIAELAQLPPAMETLPASWQIRHWLLGLQASRLHYTHFLTPACTITSLLTDTPSNGSEQIPALARARLHFCLLPDQDPLTVLQQTQQHWQEHGFTDLQISRHFSYAPVQTPLQASFVQSAIQATTQAYGQRPALLPWTAGPFPLSRLKMPVIVALIEENVVDDDLPGSKQISALAKQLAILIWQLGHPKTVS
ncbi:hypothetical protein [Tengunoibacter tsumagoiensis]|uniref:Uncharacterized protein n=1 Tax=Tengunoibacter tsumagoiensis TaxID=2014871 RepID=A0A401ZXW0_9CHLR|nr:hypothetical protein [Tengunoibacter tsumagoiensis]GCE11677.1 hypothetical protein KTT_15360 [Tengunoibacter tsumagoiensis]